MCERAIIFCSDLASWLSFSDPVEVVTARELAQVLPAIEHVEQEVRENSLYAVGYLSYESAPAFDEIFYTKSPGSLPLLSFGLFSSFTNAEMATRKTTLFSNIHSDIHWEADTSKAEYFSALLRIREHLAKGDSYQVNYSYRLHAPFVQDPWPFFLQLIKRQRRCFGAYLENDKFAICSASPELFFLRRGQTLESRPMKGTSARGLTTEEDLAFAEKLQSSEKERAENIMVVDMIRNDLAKISEPGSVRISQLCEIEKYPTVLQMTSRINAECSASLAQVIQSLFPCASITGCPKARTMEIIADAEQSPRGIYTGAIGLMCPNDYAQFNVAIRTALIDKQRQSIEYGVGGGIVWDSVPEAEFEESRIKAKVLSSPWPEFSLLETLLWTENEGFFLLERHLARLKNSAKYFDIAFSETEILNILKDTATGKQDSSLKVRLLLSHSGQASCSAEQISISPQPLSTSVVLAREAVSSKNVFLYHKTDYRDLYERHSAESPDSADVLLWNERGELTESTIANLVLEVQGKLLTPPISCGLLPGVFRAELLAAGTIKEEILTLGMLKKASSIYLVNSVRKWQKATMLS